MTSALSRSRGALSRLRRDQRGVTAVIIALTLPVLLAFGALSINSGLWFTIKRENQSAADAAAISAAYELMAGPTDACHADPNFVANRLTPAATQAVAANQHQRAGWSQGWDNTVTNTTVTCPYKDGLLDTQFGAGKYSAVSVTLQQDQSSLFAYAPLTSATIATKSVAAVKIFDTACLLALSPTGTGIGLNGTDNITMPNCSVVADSTSSSAISLNGSTNITADTVVTAGNISGISNLTLTSPPPQTFAPNYADPYQPPACNNYTPPLPCLTHSFLITGPPALSTTLCTSKLSGSVRTWSGSTPGTGNCVFTGLQKIQGETWNLSPGTYWIKDGDLQLGPGGGNSDLECTSCNGGSLGVTIIFTTSVSGGTIGTINMASSSAHIIGLNAPNSGTFAGLLFVQDTFGANPTTSGVLGGGPGFDGGNGLLYFIHTDLEFHGNPALGSSGCMILVANTVTLKGTSQLSSTGCTSAGLNTPAVKTVLLAE
jgi:Flp pilus assembly protein TadG